MQILCSAILMLCSAQIEPEIVVEVRDVMLHLDVLRHKVDCGEPILLNLQFSRLAELDITFRLGPYFSSSKLLQYQVEEIMPDGTFLGVEFPQPPAHESAPRDSQTMAVPELPLGMTFSRYDIIVLQKPGRYRIRMISTNRWGRLTSASGLEPQTITSYRSEAASNYVVVTVRSPEEVGEEDDVMSAGIREMLPERMFNYYYPQQRFLYYAYGSQTAWSRSRDRERFSLEHPWRESQAWPKDSPWREYLHFTAAAEALADSMSRFGSETSKMEYETGPTPLRPDYVEEVVCSFFKEYPDSWLRPQLLHHYNRYFFNRFGAIIPCIETAYEKCVQETEPAHAAVLESDGHPERRTIYNVYTREMKVVVE